MKPDSLPEDPELEKSKALIGRIRAAMEQTTDPEELADLHDALMCECHSAFICEIFSEQTPTHAPDATAP